MTELTRSPIAETDGAAQWVVLRLMPLADDDLIDFEDQEVPGATQKAVQPWAIMIVDDDAEVHRAVALALMSVKIFERPLQLTHCASAAEARSILAERQQAVDLMLLDVVMETADAGLTLLDELRARPTTQSLRILLHTGQPGQAPENMVRARYDISGYLTKTTVTRQVLIAALESTLGSVG